MMRVRSWKLLGGATAAAIGLVLVLANNVAGQAADEQQPGEDFDAESDAADRAYELGPHTIRYDDQSPQERANIDRLGQKTFSDQQNVDAYSRAVSQLAEAAKAEIEARAIGLVGDEEIGVVP